MTAYDQNLDKILSESLKNSILNRTCETSTGYLKVPSDLIKRVKKELDSIEPNWKIKSAIQHYVNSKTS